tara:strand:+ start:311 stop:868 length:558 start_codon:yes stop_codon:yes gene_type:complete
MGWIDILKRVDIHNEREYEAASLDDRRKWHSNQATTYSKRWRTMRNTQVDNEDSPMYKEMVELQDLANFHSRQQGRIKHNNQTYYSRELEGENRQKHKSKKSPQGNLIPYTELSQEIYDTLSNQKKIKYHVALKEDKNIPIEERKFHARMYMRLRNNFGQTFTSSQYGGESLRVRNNSQEEEGEQ